MSWQRNQLAVTVAAFVGFTGFTLVMPFMAVYVGQLGVSDTGEIALWTGATLGVTPAVTALIAPLWGRVGDRFGNKLLVQRSLASAVVIMTLMAYATRAWHVFALRAVQGLVAGYGPLTISMAALSAPRDRMAAAIGMVQTAQRIAPAVGPVIGGVLAAQFGLRAAFLISAGVYAAAFLLMTAIYTETPRAPQEREEAGRVTFASVLALENFLLLLLVIFGLQLVDRSFGPVLLLHVRQLGFAPGQAELLVGALFSALAISGAVGHKLAGDLLRRLSARAALAGTALAAAAALALFALASGSIWLFVTIALFGTAVGTGMTVAFTAAGAVVPRHAHATSFGFLASASLIGSAVSPVLSGLVGSRSIRVVFGAGVALLVLLAVLVRRVMAEPALEIEAPSVEES